MTERKVINKYYPPDYDPSKIPKLKHREKEKNRLWSIRVMAPFNMRCNTCAEYIYKGKKFNSRKETVEDEDYLGLQIHRFYIRCPRCVAVIAFKTDPQNCDYTLEAGASRNFEAAKTAEAMEKKAQQAREEEEANNPMKVLENRTKQSRLEMESIEVLEELRDNNARHAKLDYDKMIHSIRSSEEIIRKRQEDEDEAEVLKLFGSQRALGIKRVHEPVGDEEDSISGEEMKHGANVSGGATCSAEITDTPKIAAPVPQAEQLKQQPPVESRGQSKAARFGIVRKKPNEESKTAALSCEGISGCSGEAKAAAAAIRREPKPTDGFNLEAVATTAWSGGESKPRGRASGEGKTIIGSSGDLKAGASSTSSNCSAAAVAVASSARASQPSATNCLALVGQYSDSSDSND